MAVDAIGGDFAPAEIVKGSVDAAGEGGVKVLLVGQPEVVEKELESWCLLIPGLLADLYRK